MVSVESPNEGCSTKGLATPQLTAFAVIFSGRDDSAGSIPKTKARVGGEHRDPGWLFRIDANWRAGYPASGLGQSCRGADSLTLTKDAGLAARVRVTEQRYRL